MHSISSSGGPLIALPESLLPSWRGAADGGSHYRLACAVTDYAGVAHLAGQELLVLGDEPLQTAVSNWNDTIVIARWLYAPDEAAIVRCIDQANWGEPVETLAWQPSESRYVLMDSAREGTNPGPSLELAMTVASYAVATCVVKPNPDVGAILHTLRRQ